MTVATAHRVALIAVVVLPVLGLSTGSTVLRGSGALLAVAVLAAVPHLYARTRSTARLAAVHGLTLVGLALALTVVRSAGVDAALGIVMLGMFNRTWLRVGQRDDLIVVGSAAVLMAAVTVVTPGISFLLLIVLFVPAALWLMLTSTLLGLSGSGRNRDPIAFSRLASRPIPRLRGALTGFGLALMLAGYVAVSFLPRHRFGHGLSAGGLVTFIGPGPSMQLDAGGVGGSEDQSIRVRVAPTPGVDLDDLHGLYVRIHALDEIDGLEFRESPGPARSLATVELGGPTAMVSLRRFAGRGEVQPLALIGQRTPTAVALPRLQERASGTWTAPVASFSLELRYEASLTEAAALGHGAEDRFLAVSDLDPRIEALARRLTDGAKDDGERVAQILGYFDGFRYTTDKLEGTDPNPLARFLFEARAGHCELYAGAVVQLLRAAGVPARVATGYYGGWINRRARSVEFGAEDAHAWVEVWLDGRWTWVDATPPSERARRSGKRLAWLFDLWDAAEALWYVYVIDFDEERRRSVVGALREAAGHVGEMDPWEVSAWFGPRARGLGLGPWVGLFAAGSGVLAVWWRRRTAIDRLGARLHRRLGRAQAPSRPLGLLALAHPDRAAATRAVQLYESARFGAPGRGPPLSEVGAAIDRIGKAAKT